MKFVYPAVFRETAPGRIRADFPDLEGCYAEGETIEEALEKAKEAETDWIMLELEEGCDLPPRSGLEDLQPENGAVVRNVAATIRLPDGYDQ